MNEEELRQLLVEAQSERRRLIAEEDLTPQEAQNRINGMLQDAHGFDSIEALQREVSRQGEPVNKLLGSLQAISQGITLGFGDEFAGLGAILPGGQTPGEAIEESRGLARRFRRDEPAAALAGNVAGGLATGLIGGAAAGAGKTLLGTVGRSAGIGGLEGLIGGAGGAEGGVGERLAPAAIGGTIGTVLGAAAPAVVGTGRGLARTLGAEQLPGVSAFRAARVQRRAAEEASDILEGVAQQHGLAPSQVITELAEGPALPMDTPIGRNIVNAATRRSAAATTDVERELARRASAGRVAADVASEEAETGLRVFRDGIETKRDELAERVFAGLAGEPVEMTDDLARVLKKPSVRRVLPEVEGLLEEAGLPPLDLDNLDASALQLIRRGLRDAQTRAFNPASESFSSAQGGAIKTTVGELDDALERAVPGFKAGRREFALVSRALDAVDDDATKVLRMTPRELEEIVNDPSVTDEIRQSLRLKAQQEIADQLGEGKPLAKVLRESPNMQRRIRALFGDDANKVLEMVAQNEAEQETAKQVGAGLRRARRQQVEEGFKGRPPSNIVEEVRSNVNELFRTAITFGRGSAVARGIGSGVVGRAEREAAEVGGEAARRITRGLLSTPEEISALLGAPEFRERGLGAVGGLAGLVPFGVQASGLLGGQQQ